MVLLLRRAIVLAATCVACASSRSGNPPEPVPPPRGALPPRLDPAPGPGPEEPPERRFPVLEARARREAARRDADARQQGVELVEVPGQDPCAQLSAHERVSCPLSSTSVTEVEEIPGGVRLHFRPGSVKADHLIQVFACQDALARVGGGAPICPFVDRDTRHQVRDRRGRVMADLIPASGASLRTLRERVRVAFPKATP